MPRMPEIRYGQNARDFIDDALLAGLLEQPPPSAAEVRTVIAKSMAKEPLALEETATLLRADDPDVVEEMFQAARQLKRDVYGNRIVLFAPLYVGNACVNDCQYCGFRRSNPEAIRRTLKDDDLREQVRALEASGHKRLILAFGEHPAYSAEYIAHVVRIVYETKTDHDGPCGEIRRVNINAAPMDHDGYRLVHQAGIGTYQIFQETYHKETYARMHPPHTRKGDFLYRLDGLSRAMEAGCDDVGIGALFGLHDWRFEVLGLVSHARFLHESYGVGPHTISFPRLQPASGINLDPKWLVSDYDFKRVIATLRLSVPYTGMILTARERPELRREVLAFGVSQIDAGSRIEIGGYTEAGDAQVMEREQFVLGDIRSLDTVVHQLLEDGYVPSWCTACYRLGRTGEHFMEYAIPGFIERLCTPNALATLVEYLEDYGTPETREAGEALVAAMLDKMEDDNPKKALIKRLGGIRDEGLRDQFI
ncbi:MAG TPA: [FeFe] hydrogenase H-cluster radical SAM maturase HydG [Longimicrobiales bacterium]|nr:[FeFe] hydrogenase H-cluster radical SAM maturase HydG [Longimicrobiales bacterium]